MTALLALLLAGAPLAAQEWTIDPSTGYFRALLMKEGLLGALGHDHVVDVRGARGTVAIAGSSGSVRLELDAASAEIDAPQSRREEGLDDELSEGDRAKVRAGMRGPKGLDARRFPLVRFDSSSVERVEGMPRTWMVSGTFSLHGSTGTLDFPVTLAERPGGWWAWGYVRVRPSDYGVKPFSVAAGLIRVQDEALVKFNLGLRASGPPGR